MSDIDSALESAPVEDKLTSISYSPYEERPNKVRHQYPPHLESANEARYQQRQRRMAAYHEAGHAVVGITLGRTLDTMTIVPEVVDGELVGGYCRWEYQPVEETWADLFLEIAWLKAGHVAQALACRVTWLDYGAVSDDASAQKIADSLHRHLTDDAMRREQVKATLKRATDLARSIVLSPNGRTALQALADRLLERGTVSGEEGTLLVWFS